MLSLNVLSPSRVQVCKNRESMETPQKQPVPLNREEVKQEVKSVENSGK